MKFKQFIPTRSAFAHLRLVFSVFLLPVYLFAFSQASAVKTWAAVLVFFIWHFLAFPASNGYNSYFDKDEDSIALLAKPPEVDLSLYYFSILLEAIAFLLGFIISWEFACAVLIYGIMSKLYSHPATRLKKYPIISFLTVFIFQGCFIYYTTYTALTGTSLFDHWDLGLIIPGAISSCLIGASYPLTQVYQHEEDSRRGDKTLSIVLGYKGSFIFSGVLFAAGIALSYWYWHLAGMMLNFYFFIACAAPIFFFFNYWFYKVGQSTANANFKNAMRMNFISSGCMLIYFGVLAVFS
ncbi:ubiquinone biosynthesis protein UbiA [Mucilaginibacter rubeus]|uniref:UbiA prenyltransferase family protein n=1 Tax=Mucilaginibacter rubeus TaxID=2027860 RepID=A0AAE6JLJ0_9SPHI|nr:MULTISPECIES: UbiA family prenyltransferase [Mucilaginibacter]QEM06975.1 ubiquinone biosynthesis protein UbiA [Mucilaginibacter rubeus]QEM19563.1 ubiquinone biosynthesis protein UbiA [Mucilaginibacter gossypii]QTE43883.1 UbiA prenyltransferase family protein [Mucilaginibacter rubeus]QTE50484.1 UbiA prenyltransferase family protein [Mucilaginibacter rubeus]QTE55569.1 UbiA prenyltransferase family protein [Mucilaginibacter rubeus]